jgi:hypothetical protein
MFVVIPKETLGFGARRIPKEADHILTGVILTDFDHPIETGWGRPTKIRPDLCDELGAVEFIDLFCTGS